MTLYDLLGDKYLNDVIFFLYYIKQVDSLLLFACSVIVLDHRKHQCRKNVRDTLGYCLMCYYFVLTTF